MNLTTIGHIPSSNLKRIKSQYVAAVAGVALAVSACRSLRPEHLRHGVSGAEPRRAQSSSAEPARQTHEDAFRTTRAAKQAVLDTLSFPLQPQASDADIAASVLSTERANYLAPVTSAKVEDADVLASALSGEMATYVFGATQPVQRQVADADIAASVLTRNWPHTLPNPPGRKSEVAGLNARPFRFALTHHMVALGSVHEPASPLTGGRLKSAIVSD